MSELEKRLNELRELIQKLKGSQAEKDALFIEMLNDMGLKVMEKEVWYIV